MSFDWQTEEDGDWEDLESLPSNSNEKKTSGKRRWLWWFVFLGLILVTVTAVGWTVSQRVQTSTRRVEGEVLASFELVNQAVERQDSDLFMSVLSGRDPDWSNAMAQMVADGELTSRQGIGLTSLSVSESITPTISVSADLSEAEVTTLVPYAIEVGNGLTETVALAQTAVFRLGSTNRWLLAPPDLAYWGDTRQIKGQYVNLFYPERDKEIAQDLLLSLDAKVGQICTQLSDVDCPDEYQVIVELATDPATFSNLDLFAVAAEAGSQHLILPTPTLVGLPEGETAKGALFRGYGQLVAGDVLISLWDEPYHSEPFYYVLLIHSLMQLGLNSGTGITVTVSDYDSFFNERLPSLFSSDFWYDSDRNNLKLETKAAILYTFLNEELGLTIQEMMTNIDARYQSRSFGEWLYTFSNNNLSVQELDNTWLSFVYNNTSYAQEEPPVPFLDQDIQLLCRIGDEERLAFYRYDLAENETILEQPLNRFVENMVALPDDSGLAVWENEDEASLTQMFLWKNGEKTEISWDAAENAPSPVPLHTDPTNSKIILAPAQFDQMNYGLLDAAGCLGNDCQLDTVTGYPLWSSDMAHMILLNGAMVPPHEARVVGLLTLADENAEVIRELEIGASPFWLNDEQFGFVLPQGELAHQLIVVGRVDDTVGQNWDVLISVDKLTAVLDDDERLIDFVSLDPKNRDQLVIVTSSRDQNVQTLFIYNWVEKEVVLTHSLSVKDGRNRSYRFSPNGRFLLMSQYEFEGEQQNNLFITDLIEGEMSRLTLAPNPESSVHWVADFSKDGEWLLVSDENVLYLLLLGSDYERLIFPETGVCKTAVFVNKNE